MKKMLWTYRAHTYAKYAQKLSEYALTPREASKTLRFIFREGMTWKSRNFCKKHGVFEVNRGITAEQLVYLYSMAYLDDEKVTKQLTKTIKAFDNLGYNLKAWNDARNAFYAAEVQGEEAVRKLLEGMGEKR